MADARATAAATTSRLFQAMPAPNSQAVLGAGVHRFLHKGQILLRQGEPASTFIPRLRAMVDKVVSRHGARLPRLAMLQQTFAELQHELLDHMKKEDVVLFPAIVALEAGDAAGRSSGWTWIDQPIGAMEVEHASAGAALERIAELTDDYVPPADACPTFRGLYHGLSELERDMHVHVHLENHILFPRAAALARSVMGRTAGA